MIVYDEGFEEVRKVFQNIPIEERSTYLSKLTSHELSYLYEHPRIFLWDKQIPPDRPWRYHWFRGGRGIGKSFASTSWLYEKIIGGAREVAIVGPSYPDLVREILPTFESHFPPNKKPKYNNKDGMYKCYNDCIVKVYSSDTEIRGLNAEYGVAEEMCKWCDQNEDKIKDSFQLFNLGIRSNRAKPPQIFIASTPKPFKFFIDFDKRVREGDLDYSMVIAETKENIFLSEAAKKAYYKEYSGTRKGRQELYGDLLVDNPDALWTTELLKDDMHISFEDFMRETNHENEKERLRVIKTVVAIDPAVTSNPSSDETGIIVASLCSDNRIYVLEDASGRWTPNEWAQKAVSIYKKYNAAQIITEINQGGNLILDAIRAINPYVRIMPIHASVNKAVRFEPVVAVYERHEIKHIGYLAELEQQMLLYNPYKIKTSANDRIDALAYCVYYLKLMNIATPIERKISAFGKW
jgi:phage terminase large subunit-like protein